MYAAFIAFKSGGGSSHTLCGALACTFPLMTVSANGNDGNACSASHSRAIVDMFARCDRYHRLESPAQKNNQTRTRPSSLSSHNASDIRRGEPDAVDKRRDGVI